ncbi:hypothetical protein SporoP8_10935 [Sporosarcina ureae]|uniref:sporulation-delaying protein SdpB family protein n=1 Tax=Sporosarcina ureae TaxID=1571 RepID=UPI000A15EA73|nr:sporulation-delaying protein SdpB family protein [Sporosarcina ureae]ARJ39342.1 hypothetical protein SporoP8_10935 [Sporosarcina ureae]
MNINFRIEKWLSRSNPFTNVYGLARTFLASSSLLLLLFNNIDILFKPTSDTQQYPTCSANYSLFCLTEFSNEGLAIMRWICIIALLVIASGWRPRFTGWLHAWIAFSLYHSATTIDGGEQVVAVFTLILIPLTLMDDRKWHWQKPVQNLSEIKKIIGMTSYYAFRLQVAILYFHSVVAKIAEENWVDGTAVWYYIQSPMLGLNKIMLDFFHPILSSAFIVVPTWGTLLLQTLLVISLVIDKKYWKHIFVLAILMHEVFAIFLGLITFSLAMVGVLLLYLWPLEETFQFKGVRNLVSSINTKSKVSKKENELCSEKKSYQS